MAGRFAKLAVPLRAIRALFARSSLPSPSAVALLDAGASRAPTVRTEPRAQAMSGASTIITQGDIFDLDPNARLRGPLWYGTPWAMGEAQKMDRDAHVRRARDSVIAPLLASDWAIESASKNPIDVEVAAFVGWQLFERNPWRATLRAVLNYLRDGFALLEVTDDFEPIPLGRFPLHPQPRAALVVTGFHPIPAWSVDGFQQNPANTRQLRAVEQWIAGSDAERPGLRSISADRVLRWTWEQEGANYTGLAPQRSAWGDWHSKLLLKVIDMMAHERHHLGIPIAHIEGEIEEEDLLKLKATLRNLRAHEHGYAILPNGVKFEWSTVNGAQLTNIGESIWRCDHGIAHNFGAGFMLLGAKQTGAFNVGETQAGQHSLDVKAHAGFIEDGINCGSDGWSVIERIVRANYGARVAIPRLRARNLPTEPWERLLPIIHNLTTSGQLTPDERTEDFLRSVLRLPPSDLETRRAPKISSVSNQAPADPSDRVPEEQGA